MSDNKSAKPTNIKRQNISLYVIGTVQIQQKSCKKFCTIVRKVKKDILIIFTNILYFIGAVLIEIVKDSSSYKKSKKFCVTYEFIKLYP